MLSNFFNVLFYIYFQSWNDVSDEKAMNQQCAKIWATFEIIHIVIL